MEHTIGSELPNRTFTWTENGNIIDFSSGWTFTVRIGKEAQPAVFQKTSGITGAATAPNVTIVWNAGELDAVPAGAYMLQIIPRHTATGKEYEPLTEPFTVKAPVAAPV